MKRFLSFALILCISSSTLVCFAEKIVFSDVDESDWFYEDVKYVSQNKLMNGTSNTEFSPEELTTRGMIVTILWRLEGEPTEKGKEFDDVAEDTYYHKAVSWAATNGIVSGYSETAFGPEDAATREQLAAIIYRYASYKKCDLSKTASLDGYNDKNAISDYAVKSLEWASANGIITGTTNETLSPKDFVTRCQIAAILKRLCINVISANKIPEVPEKTEPEIKADEKLEEDVVLPDKEDNNSGNGGSQGNSGGGIDSNNDKDYKEGSPSDITPNPEEDNEVGSGTEIFVGNVTGEPGEEIKVAINVKNNPGILGMVLAVYYDEEKCTLTNVENGEVFKDVLNLTTSKTLESGARFVWDGIDIADNDIQDGEVLVMTFKITENAPDGICQIEIESINNDIMDKNLETIYPPIKSGFINITSK